MDTGVEVACGMVEDKCVRGSGSIVWDGVGAGGGSGRAGMDAAEGEGVAFKNLRKGLSYSNTQILLPLLGCKLSHSL